MNFIKKWEKMQERIYLSYIVIILIFLGICAYISYALSSLDTGTFLPLFLLITYLLIEKYRAKKYEKSVIYIFLGTILLFILELGKIIKNNFLTLLFFFLYSYIMLPFFAEYKKEKDLRSKILSFAKILLFIVLFFVFVYLAYGFG